MTDTNGTVSDAAVHRSGPSDDRPPPTHYSAQQVAQFGQAILDELDKAVIGKRDVLSLVLVGALADGHVLLEDVPGLAKTLIARSFATVTGLGFSRVQFTPDLVPGDITGSVLFNPATQEGLFHPGPLFANLVLGDEINRAPPKTQAALLEAMAEGQVTADGTTHKLPDPFLVLATQNPIESEGTYPLPEAQVDRFLLKTGIGYPSTEAEIAMVMRRAERHTDEVHLQPVMDAKTLLALQAAVEHVAVAPELAAYMVGITEATRANPRTQAGASPRGSLALLKCSRAWAALSGRDFVTPDDVQAVARPALAHRIVLSPDEWVRGTTGAAVVDEVLRLVPLPETLNDEDQRVMAGQWQQSAVPPQMQPRQIPPPAR